MAFKRDEIMKAAVEQTASPSREREETHLQVWREREKDKEAERRRRRMFGEETHS